jgi:hypothetical protein
MSHELKNLDSCLTRVLDSEEQKNKFVNDPDGFDEYVRGLEGELNKRFTLVGYDFRVCIAYFNC